MIGGELPVPSRNCSVPLKFSNISLAPLMEDDKQEGQKRVSFAAEPQINYIHQKENSTSMTNSSMLDIAMDITTELAEFKNLNLFSGCNEPEEDGNNESQASDIETTTEMENLMNNGIFKRKSLDPLKFIGNGPFSGANDSNINPENGNLTVISRMKRESAETNDSKHEESGKSQSLFWRSSIRNEPPKNENGPLDDTGTINSSFGVEELVNTIDLRRIIPQEWKERIGICEFLAAQGIRFLDETVINGMKRDTLSKSRNEVVPSLIIYYKYSLNERIGFLYNFSSFLIDKMKDLQSEIEVVEATIDVNTVNKENLKRIRNEARNKAKIDWYSLRKIYEIQFNKKMIENKNKVVDVLANLKRDVTKTKETIDMKQKSVTSLELKIWDLKDKVSRFERENIQKTEKLQEMIEERRKVYESAKQDLESMFRTYEMQEKEKSAVQKKIERLQKEIADLKKNIAIKNVSEGQLDDVKRQVEEYGYIYHFKVVKITKHSMLFEVFGSIISVDVNSLIDVIGFSILRSEGDPFSEFSRSLIQNFELLKLPEFLRKCLEIFYLSFSLRKEVNLIKKKVKIECFYLNENLYLRIHPISSKGLLDLTITSKFDMLHDNSICGNVKASPGSLSLFISQQLDE